MFVFHESRMTWHISDPSTRTPGDEKGHGFAVKLIIRIDVNQPALSFHRTNEIEEIQQGIPGIHLDDSNVGPSVSFGRSIIIILGADTVVVVADDPLSGLLQRGLSNISYSFEQVLQCQTIISNGSELV